LSNYDVGKDLATGLPDRQAFLELVKKTLGEMPPRLRRGCLLILKFTGVKSICVGQNAEATADDALKYLLAIIETRVRSRDAIGRIGPHSLCILLKSCREQDAIVVADQYAALLSDVLIGASGRQFPMDLRYRIVPLDARGVNKPTPGMSRVVVAPALPSNLQLAKQIHVAGNRVDLSASKVVSLNAARVGKLAHSDAGATPAATSAIAAVHTVGVEDNAQSWRLRPGQLMQRKSLVCCFRLQPVGVIGENDTLQNSRVFRSILSALSIQAEQSRPIIESQIVLPIQAEYLDADVAAWIVSRCKAMRVAPSDICLSIGVESISQQLSTVAATLRALNRAGVSLMLEGISLTNQIKAMASVAHFDYIYISGRSMNDSLAKVLERSELEAIVSEAKENHCEITAGGIDSPAMLQHAINMKVEIGFGRQCGVSTSFPEAAWIAGEAYLPD